MSAEPEIICKDLTIKFPLFDSVSRSVMARVAGGQNQPVKSFTALDGISVTIEKGEKVGLIGKNGAGKSTFLRTLAGVYPPTSGDVQISGGVTSLFSTNVGVDNNASGYENIPLLMAARGIPRSRLNEVIADVENFTELGEALARPLRTYSSGMKLRISFAVATFACEEILLMDEVVGVGDARFRKKSQERINAAMESAEVLVLASHADALLEAHCDRGIVFNSGKIEFDGKIEEAIKSYR